MARSPRLEPPRPGIRLSYRVTGTYGAPQPKTYSSKNYGWGVKKGCLSAKTPAPGGPKGRTGGVSLTPPGWSPLDAVVSWVRVACITWAPLDKRHTNTTLCCRDGVVVAMTKHADTPRKVMTFRIDDDLIEGMDKLWERDGIAVSEQVRRALRVWLESKGIKTARKREKGR